MELPELAEDLKRRKEEILQMGGPEQVAKQHAAGKLTARERVDLLFDPGSFDEMGILGHHQSTHPEMINKKTPADGVITGVGTIGGRPVAVAAYDFTVMAGSMGSTGEKKVARLREWAMRQRMPMVWLLDSAGARIQESVGSTFAAAGDVFYQEVIMSGLVPMVGALMGPCAAGTAYVPALTDFIPMVKGTSSMAIGGPHLVKAAVGEDIDVEALGGSKIHTEISGVADLEVANDEECIQAIKDFLSYLPSNSMEPAPVVPTGDPIDRYEPDLAKIVPASPRRAYDMHRVIAKIADEGKFFPIKPAWAKNLITGFARLGGESIGIVANQPLVMGGALDVDCADKAARFIWLCDAYNIPLLFLMDVPGFLVGSEVEKKGIIRHGAKWLYAVSEATVPKITVILRKAYGAGYFVMCGKGYEPDLIVAWPTAEISVMGPEGAVNIIFRREIAQAANPEQVRAERIEQFRQTIDPYIAARQALIDDIIDPGETRRVVIQGLRRAKRKHIERPPKKHGVPPV